MMRKAVSSWGFRIAGRDDPRDAAMRSPTWLDDVNRPDCRRSAPCARPSHPMRAAVSVAHRVGSCTMWVGSRKRAYGRSSRTAAMHVESTGFLANALAGRDDPHHAAMRSRAWSGMSTCLVVVGAHRARDRHIQCVLLQRSPTGWAPSSCGWAAANPRGAGCPDLLLCASHSGHHFSVFPRPVLGETARPRKTSSA